jgi:hypothetical protein
MLLPFKRFWVTSGLNTTMIYVHVDKTHIEQAWAVAGRRAVDRFRRPMTMKWNLFCSSWNKSASGRPAGRRGPSSSQGVPAGCR